MDLGRHLLDNPFEERCSGSEEREVMEKVMQADLDCEDRVETGIKPNTRMGNDGVLELRGGSQVSEGAGCVWEGGTRGYMCTYGFGGQRTISSSIPQLSLNLFFKRGSLISLKFAK